MCKSSNQGQSKAFWDLGQSCRIPYQTKSGILIKLVCFNIFWKRTVWFFPFAATLHLKCVSILKIIFFEVQWNGKCWLRKIIKPFCLNLSNQTSVILGWQEEFWMLWRGEGESISHPTYEILYLHTYVQALFSVQSVKWGNDMG